MGVADKHIPESAAIMKALGLRSGFIQTVSAGSAPNNDYTFAVCFDNLAVVHAIRNLDPESNSSFIRADCTMLG